MTLEEVYEKYNAPWDIIQFDARSKFLREGGRYYGVETKTGQIISSCITLEEATMIALAPEMFAGEGLNIDTDAIVAKIKKGGIRY